AYEALLNATDLRGRVLEIRQRLRLVLAEGVQQVIRRLAGRLAASNEPRRVVTDDHQDVFVSSRGALEEALGLVCFQAQTIQKWTLAFRSRAVAEEVEVIVFD